jgi:uncharacterized protein YjbI with pentapeptide repeats
MVVQKKAMSASGAKVILRAGKPLENCHIEEPLELSGTFSKNIEIINCRIEEIRTKQDCVFQSDVRLLNVNITGMASFVNAEFFGKCEMAEIGFGYAEFYGSKFKSEANFRFTEFREFADFSEVVFERSANFRNAIFEHGADFCSVKFKNKADFEQSEFHKKVFFNDSKFYNTADFDGCKIKHYADFRRAEFMEDVEFRGAISKPQQENNTNTGLYFNHVKIHGNCNFGNSEFDVFTFSNSEISGDFYFKDVTLLNSVSFEGSQFTKNFNFLDSGKMKSRKTGGPYTICLLAAFNGDVKVEWDQIIGKIYYSRKKNHAKACEEFRGLKEIFEKNDDYESMDRAYEMYRHHKNMADSKLRLIKWLEFFFLMQCSGYGTRPFRFLLVALAVILSFAVFYSFQVEQFNFLPDSALGFFFFFSLMTFIAGGIEGVHPNFDGWMKHVVAFESFSGILLMTLFTVMLARKFLQQK